MSRILGVIPARYASSRFPGKPLVNIRGKSMIRRVYEQCEKAAKLTDIMVATDDSRIFDHVSSWGGTVVMTQADHASGTERVSEVARKSEDYTHYVNIQGDEPFIDPEQIDLLCDTLTSSSETDIATLLTPFTDIEVWESPNTVKVVTNHQGYALYFSRSLIPFVRGKAQKDWPRAYPYMQHIGIYGFRRDVLFAISEMKPTELEKAESLEQLRWLYYGYRIKTAVTSRGTIGVDTPEDLDRLPFED